MHPLAARFAAVACEYELGRPEYAPAVIGATAAELGLVPGDPVLDLAAGTGKLTRALVAGGYRVTAVEPLASLRALLSERVEPAARVLDGIAEAIPLDDGAVAAVTIADAFHWFDRPRALAEVRRVLRPRGGLALFNTVPDWSGASWAHELGQLVAGSRPEHPHFDGPPWQQFVRQAHGWSEPWSVRVTTYPAADPERILAHMASMSWIAAMPDPQRTEVLARIAALLRGGETPERMPLHVEVGLAVRVE
jgi:SAM-dependent methyltransferase